MAKPSCGESCMGYTLFLFNFIFFLSGAAVLGVGVWLTVDPVIGEYLAVLSVDNNDQIWQAATISFIVAGCVVVIAGVLGWCGACLHSPSILCAYIVLLSLVLVVELLAVILAVIFRDQLASLLSSTLQSQAAYLVTDDYSNPDVLSSAWHNMQIDLECCGGYDWFDYNNNTRFPFETKPVPLTCCVLQNADPKFPLPTNEDLCYTDVRTPGISQSIYFHTGGCNDALAVWLSDRSVILIAVGAAFLVLQILGIVFAACLRKLFREDEKA